MAIVYEVNPPRVEDGQDVRTQLESMADRLGNVIKVADGLLVTDGVLGTRRIGALDACAEIISRKARTDVMMSMRTRDRSIGRIGDDIAAAARTGVSGVLLVRGDPPQYEGAHDSGLYPGAVLAGLRAESSTCGLRMLLSLPTVPDAARTQKKLAARPDGFVTQVIASAAQATKIVTEMRAHSVGVMPCVMIPSPKNAASARTLGLDWSSYEGDASAFVRHVHEIAGNVLVTSPRDRAMAESVIAAAH